MEIAIWARRPAQRRPHPQREGTGLLEVEGQFGLPGGRVGKSIQTALVYTLHSLLHLLKAKRVLTGENKVVAQPSVGIVHGEGKHISDPRYGPEPLLEQGQNLGRQFPDASAGLDELLAGAAAEVAG